MNLVNSFKSISSWVIIGLIAALMPLIFDSYFALTLLSKMGVLVMFTVAYNMLLGQGGMLSFGQGIAVTGIQMAAAVAAIANDGMYVKPRIVRYFTDSEQQTRRAVPIQETTRVVSVQTAKKIKKSKKLRTLWVRKKKKS